jgi:hypothetical protein
VARAQAAAGQAQRVDRVRQAAVQAPLPRAHSRRIAAACACACSSVPRQHAARACCVAT